MSDVTKTPIIVGFVTNLFTTKIQYHADAAGFQMKWVAKAADIGEGDATFPPESPGELLHGRGGRLFQIITEWQPALLLFDLTNTDIPWYGWLPALKASPATKRIPIIAFAPDEEKDLLPTAKSRGADLALAQSHFFADMPNLFRSHARLPDRAAIEAACADPLAELAKEGIRLFNQGAYYKCHDALEEAWNQDQTAGRDLYQGILQYGIAIYQIERGNFRGAVKMLLRVRQWLTPLPDVCRGIHVSKLRQNIELVSDTLQNLGPERLEAFDTAIITQIEFIE